MHIIFFLIRITFKYIIHKNKVISYFNVLGKHLSMDFYKSLSLLPLAYILGYNILSRNFKCFLMLLVVFPENISNTKHLFGPVYLDWKYFKLIQYDYLNTLVFDPGLLSKHGRQTTKLLISLLAYHMVLAFLE